MKRYTWWMWSGLAIYTTSFFIPAIQVSGSGLPGWFSAEFALQQWAQKDLAFKPNPISVAVALSGLINLLFVITVVLALVRKCLLLTRILRVIQLSLMTFPWIVFIALYPQRVYPREGFLAWTLGMLLMLFS